MTSIEAETVLTIEDIERAVEYLKEIAGDDEAAHVFEDELRDRVLFLIAEGKVSAIAAARTVLLTSEISFGRWMA